MESFLKNEPNWSIIPYYYCNVKKRTGTDNETATGIGVGRKDNQINI